MGDQASVGRVCRSDCPNVRCRNGPHAGKDGLWTSGELGGRPVCSGPVLDQGVSVEWFCSADRPGVAVRHDCHSVEFASGTEVRGGSVLPDLAVPVGSESPSAELRQLSHYPYVVLRGGTDAIEDST